MTSESHFSFIYRFVSFSHIEFVKTLSLILLSSVCLATYAQEPRDSVSTGALVLASIPPVIVVGGAILQNYNAFWKQKSGARFHISADPPYAMHNDKLGHAWFTAVAADIISQGYEFAGVKTRTARWLGAGLAFTAQLLVEIEDGLHEGPQFGLSPGDMFGNAFGAALPVGRVYWPALESVSFKYGIQASEAYRAGAYKTIFDDNESQFFWLSIDVVHLTRMTERPFFLNFAIGYGVENLPAVSWLPSRAGKSPASQWYIAFDINPHGIPIEGALWKTIARFLSYIRIPGPAVRISPDAAFFWLKW